MPNLLRVPTEVVYTLGAAFDGIVYAVYMAVILTVGAIIWYAIWWGFEYIVLHKERVSFYVLKKVDENTRTWMQRPSRTCGNVWHLIIQTLYYSGLVIIVWLAAASAGFNPWTSAAASIGMSVIATYAFATPLGLLGAGYFVHLSNAISVGEFYEFYGMGEQWEGKIVAIHRMWVEMIRFNSDKDKMTGEMIYMPISTFLSTPRKRNWEKESKSDQQFGIRMDIPKNAITKSGGLTSAGRHLANKFAEATV